MKYSALPLMALVSSVCFGAEGVTYAAIPYDVPINSYVYSGNWIVCVTNELSESPCDRIEPFRVGDKIPSNLEPYQEIPQPNGAVALVLPIESPKGHSGYFVVTHKDSIITSVQLAGDFKVKEFSFSTISPGDPIAKVNKAFGPRYSEKPSPEIKGTLRYYDPFPFSIEYVNGVVYSIRVGQ